MKPEIEDRRAVQLAMVGRGESNNASIPPPPLSLLLRAGGGGRWCDAVVSCVSLCAAGEVTSTPSPSWRPLRFPW